MLSVEQRERVEQGYLRLLRGRYPGCAVVVGWEDDPLVNTDATAGVDHDSVDHCAKADEERLGVVDA